MQKRIVQSIWGLGALILAFLLGLTVQRAWFPPENLGTAITTPAQAAVRQNATAAPQISGALGNMPVTEVVQRVSPSVVTVGAFKRQVVSQPLIYNHFLGPIYRFAQATTRLPYMGSGFLVTDQGHVVTNHHVIEDSSSYFVTLPDGREFPARLVDADRFTDIALLQIENPSGESLPPPLELANISDIQIGQQVVTFGNPFGNLIQDSTPTITVGYVSAMHRTFQPEASSGRVYQDMIQTDAAINPGNSGGPLVNLQGEVVGVNTFIFSPSGANTGISFAIPSSRVRMFVDEIVTHGYLRPLLFDIDGRNVRVGNRLGVQLTWVKDNGPAALAGLAPGDVVVSIDGRPAENFEQLRLVFASKQIGEEVRLEVLRGRNPTPLKIVYRVQEAQRT